MGAYAIWAIRCDWHSPSGDLCGTEYHRTDENWSKPIIKRAAERNGWQIPPRAGKGAHGPYLCPVHKGGA